MVCPKKFLSFIESLDSSKKYKFLIKSKIYAIIWERNMQILEQKNREQEGKKAYQ